MAVDTRNKRMSLIGFGAPTPRVLPNPDGTVAAADRAMLLYLYAGLDIAAATPIARTLSIPRELRILSIARESRIFPVPGPR